MWIKLIPYLAVASIFFLGGLVFDSKYLTKPCPKCPEIPPCPPTTELKLQDFDVNKIKNIKHFTYSPNITGTFILKVDSTQYKDIKK